LSLETSPIGVWFHSKITENIEVILWSILYGELLLNLGVPVN
jgi:hypothetical protein